MDSHGSTTTISPALRQVLDKTDEALWHAYAAAVSRTDDIGQPRLVFPYYRDRTTGKGEQLVRVSEQEARFLLATNATRANLFYSVETPTQMMYSFSSSGTKRRFRSAQSDLTLYESWDRACYGETAFISVECKASGFSPERLSRKSIAKDMVKLVYEPSRYGLWFHVLRAANSSSVKGLVVVLGGALQEIVEGKQCHMVPTLVKPVAKPIILHICLLRQRFSIEKNITIGSSAGESLPPLQAPQLRLSRTRLERVVAANGWRTCGQGAEGV